MPYIGTSPSNGVRRVHTYTATASQTTFTGASNEGVTLSYVDTNYLDVFQNGVLLGSADYTSTSGTSVVLAQGASADDLIVIVVYDVFSVADTVSKTNGGTFDGAVTLAGGVSGGVVFNDDSASVDFRIESNDDANMFFLDGSANAIGIRTSTDHGGQLNVETTGQAYNVVLACTDDDANHGPLLDFKRISSSPADGDLLGEISFRGRNDNTEDITYATISSTLKDASDGTEDGNIFFNVMVAGTSRELLTVTRDSVVVNQDGQDIDFRVETSNGGANTFLINSADNRVEIGTNVAAANRFWFTGINQDDAYVFFGHQSSNSNLGVLYLNRNASDGELIQFRQGNVKEGDISVSGSTVSYDGFSGRHESSGIPTNTPVGTVVSTIDALDVYPNNTTDTEGNTITHPKAGQTRADHPKVEVSTSVGDPCVYGIVSEFNNDGKLIVASVGIGSIRVTGACSKGDLLESNGDGTAKVQSDDIIRSKTIGKVTIGNSDTNEKLVSSVMYCG